MGSRVKTKEALLLHMLDGWCFSGKEGVPNIYKFVNGMEKPPVHKKALKGHINKLIKANMIKYINNNVWVLTDEGREAATLFEENVKSIRRSNL